MSKKAFDKIAEGLTEALAIARGEAEAPKLHIPAEIDVKGIRSQIRLSQEHFAYEFGFTPSQIRDWEQGRSRPLRSDRAYLMLIASNPDVVRQMLAKARSAADSGAMPRAACG
jgi:putative transcriptional regulator